MAIISLATMMAVMLPGKVYALGTGEWLGIQGENLNPKGLGAAIIAKENGDAAAMDYIKECNSLHPGAIPPDEIETILNQGYLSGYVDELKALGYISQNYGGDSNNATPAQETAPSPEPTAFTVEDMPETPMWAISEVNCRNGASTDYAKIGSLKADEKVIVNGKASTGWYRFVLADGTEAYVSDKYLTDEEPDAAAEPEETVPAAEPEPEPESEQEPVAETPEPAAEEQEPVAETPEPAVEEQEPVAEAPEPATEDPGQTAEPPVVEDEAADSWILIAAGAACLCVIGIAAAVLIKRKKN